MNAVPNFRAHAVDDAAGGSPPAYGAYAEFYRRSQYAAFPQEHRIVHGSRPSSMIMVDQGRHELADPAVDELVVSIPLAAQSCSYDWNMGAGWAGGRSQTGDLIIVPPNVESRWRVGGPRKLVILAVPVDAVRQLLGAECPDDLTHAFEPLSGSSAPDAFTHALLKRLWSLDSPDEPVGRLLADSTILAMICQLLMLARGTNASQSSPGFTSRELKRVSDYVDAHLHREIVLVDLADITGWSVRHFARMFRQSTGQTPHNWVVSRRIERAKDLLRKPALPLAEVALSCGFADQSHFTTSFRKVTGLTPLKWRRELS
jgi:AraC family transcriptional regulator